MGIEFPFEEKFLDYEGKERVFEFRLGDISVGYSITAKDLNSFYEFSVCTKDKDLGWALGDLKLKIKENLSTRYLQNSENSYSFSHEKVKGNIGSGGVIIDGKFITFDEFSSMLQVYEGFNFELALRDSCDK